MNRIQKARTAGIVAILATAAGADAAMITFIHTAAFGSGTLDGVQFVRKDITITAIGDTANRVNQSPTIFAIEHISASITIQDVGTFDFLIPTRSWVNQGSARAGFGRSSDGGTGGADLVHSGDDASLAAYDLASSFGPVAGPGGFLQWDPGTHGSVSTTGGELIFSNNDGLGGTFEAILVPAPASIGVLALAGFGATRRRR